MTVAHLREHLKELRLARGWTYEELSADIQRTNGDGRISPATIRRFILDTNPARDLTTYALEQYVARQSKPRRKAS